MFIDLISQVNGDFIGRLLVEQRCNWLTSSQQHHVTLSFTLTMTSAKVVAMSDIVNSNPILDYTLPDNRITPTYERDMISNGFDMY